MDKKDIESMADHMLTNPLLTEEGFINPACMNELEMCINNMPKTHERLSEDSEWNTPKWIGWRTIVGFFAHCSIRNISDTYDTMDGSVFIKDPPCFPPDLEKVLGYLGACLRPQFDQHGYAELSLCNISKMLYDILYEQHISSFNQWNEEEVMGKSWLDLDALLHSVCVCIRDERREFDRFNKDFDERHGKTS